MNTELLDGRSFGRSGESENLSMRFAKTAVLAGNIVWPIASIANPCAFNPQKLAFQGTAETQTGCLLRPVAQWGMVATSPTTVPSELAMRVGKKVAITSNTYREYLSSNNINEFDLGGGLDTPVSESTNNSQKYPAKYFVIHDTSTPNLKNREFPTNINNSNWKHNELARWAAGNKSVAHVFVNRLGQSITAIPFERGWRSTKFELQISNTYSGLTKSAARGRFLHVELVQPRRSANLEKFDDSIAPVPGFTDAQYRRLALIYIAASIRAGEWLIPAFHAVLDTGKADAHDDPQNFKLDVWNNELRAVLTAIE